MDKLHNRTRGAFLWALSLSLGLPVGIVMIVFGFIRGGSFIGMAVVGIILTVLGFYGSPLIWIYFGTLKYFERVRKHIRGGVHSVKMLGEMHNKNQSNMASDVKKMIQRDYLPGYIVLDNEKIIDKNKMKSKDYAALEAQRAGTLNLVHCPFCGAKFELILDADNCPYCGSKVTKEMLAKINDQKTENAAAAAVNEEETKK